MNCAGSLNLRYGSSHWNHLKNDDRDSVIDRGGVHTTIDQIQSRLNNLLGEQELATEMFAESLKNFKQTFPGFLLPKQVSAPHPRDHPGPKPQPLTPHNVVPATVTVVVTTTDPVALPPLNGTVMVPMTDPIVASPPDIFWVSAERPLCIRHADTICPFHRYLNLSSEWDPVTIIERKSLNCKPALNTSVLHSPVPVVDRSTTGTEIYSYPDLKVNDLWFGCIALPQLPVYADHG